MKISIKRSQAFIIIFSLMMVALMVFLTTQLVSGVLVTTNFVSIIMQREQAKMLALSGIRIAAKQLLDLDIEKKEKKEAGVVKKDEEKDGEGKAKLSAHDKNFMKQMLPYLNRWKNFSFEEKRDGFDGELRICLTCEEGKININEAFDFKKQEFKKEYAALLKSLVIKDKLAAGELATKLQEFLTKRAKKLEDVSELMQLSACKNLDIFYKPPDKPAKKGEEPRSSAILALSDIFTVWTDSPTIDPLIFSHALCAMFTFRKPLATDATTMKDKFAQFAQQFKPELAKDWDANWETLQLLYDQKPVFFKEMQGIFSKEFGPSTYSVISYATVGKVTQRVMAIVKKVKRKKVEKKPGEAETDAEESDEEEDTAADGAKPNGQKKAKKDKYDIKVLRLYWI